MSSRRLKMLRSGAAVCAAILASFGAPGLSAPAQLAAPIPPERLNWNGDPKAPDISGVWVRVDGSTGPSASKEGWLPWPPPLKPGFAATWRKRVADDAAGTRTDDPVRGCLPPAMPRFITGSTSPLLIVQTQGRVMLFRAGSPVRRVWLDGRALPPPADLEDFYNGNARGRFEGSDLVTEVIGIKDLPIDATGVPHSDALKVVERYHRVDATTLRIEVTLTDPKAYTRPMKSVVTYKTYRDPLWTPEEFLCTPGKDYHPEAYVR